MGKFRVISDEGEVILCGKCLVPYVNSRQEFENERVRVIVPIKDHFLCALCKEEGEHHDKH